MLLFVKVLIGVLAAAGGVLALLVDFKDEQKHLTRWGKTAVAIGFMTAGASGIVTIVEYRNDQSSTAAAVDRQTKVIERLTQVGEQQTRTIWSLQTIGETQNKTLVNLGHVGAQQNKTIENLRQLVAPLDEQLTANVFFVVQATEPKVAAMATRLDGLKMPNRYFNIPSVSSANDDESELANLLDQGVLIYYCKEASCMDAFPVTSHQHPVDLTGSIENHEKLDSLTEQTAHVLVVNNLNAFEAGRGILYDRQDKVFTISFRSRKQTFSTIGQRIKSADDLTGAYVFVQDIGFGSITSGLKAVTLFQKNGKFLEASGFERVTIKNDTCPQCGAYAMFKARLPQAWIP